jgi:hypothetical protein
VGSRTSVGAVVVVVVAGAEAGGVCGRGVGVVSGRVAGLDLVAVLCGL